MGVCALQQRLPASDVMFNVYSVGGRFTLLFLVLDTWISILVTPLLLQRDTMTKATCKKNDWICGSWFLRIRVCPHHGREMSGILAGMVLERREILITQAGEVADWKWLGLWNLKTGDTPLPIRSYFPNLSQTVTLTGDKYSNIWCCRGQFHSKHHIPFLGPL